MNQSSLYTRISKAAQDNGFDILLFTSDDFVSFGSTKCTSVVWISVADKGLGVLLGLSKKNIGRSLGLKEHSGSILPQDAVFVSIINDIESLHNTLKRVFQLSRSLPNAILENYKEKIKDLKRDTEVERTVLQRVGQDLFREGLLDYWDEKCSVSGLHFSSLLVASHIKPWAVCDTDDERLDVFNGLLLSPNLDKVFDKGLISFDKQGSILISSKLTEDHWPKLGISNSLFLRRFEEFHDRYMEWHRTEHFVK